MSKNLYLAHKEIFCFTVAFKQIFNLCHCVMYYLHTIIFKRETIPKILFKLFNFI